MLENENRLTGHRREDHPGGGKAVGRETLTTFAAERTSPDSAASLSSPIWLTDDAEAEDAEGPFAFEFDRLETVSILTLV